MTLVVLSWLSTTTYPGSASVYQTTGQLHCLPSSMCTLHKLLGEPSGSLPYTLSKYVIIVDKATPRNIHPLA